MEGEYCEGNEMIRFNKDELRDKIYACWLGKNIGGTLGGPFECIKGTVECDGFVIEKGKPLPNDDLDLQLVWLMAIHEEGPQRVNASLLGTYWDEYITPPWGEYGVTKGNMRLGITPPLSGQYMNEWKHSNGAWIRTEVWACMYPGDVEMAVHYAFEDASVDHGMGEGTYAAVFVAAMEAAAFFVNDLRELITIGLSNIPKECKMYTYISKAVECYDNGMTWLEARNILTDMTLQDPELGWMQAPANVGYAIIGLLWGEGDFKETLLIACRCGDDTDCTCATAGSLLGIMHGTRIIPKDWHEYIGDEIVTISLNEGNLRSYYKIDQKTHFHMPKTCTELTDKIMKILPVTLYKREIELTSGETEIGEDVIASFYGEKLSLHDRAEYAFETTSDLCDYRVEYDGGIDVLPNSEKKITVVIHNKFLSVKLASFEWILPEGWTVEGRKNMKLVGSWVRPWPQTEFVIRTTENVVPKNMLILKITYESHHNTELIPVLLLG